MSNLPLEPAESQAGATLLIGGEKHPGVDHVDASNVSTLLGTYREVVLQIPIESLADPWTDLRTLHDHVAPDGVLTVFSHLPETPARALLRLAGFTVMHETPASRRYRARPRRHVARDYSCTVVIPCLNEAGNVSDAVRRVPVLGTHTELIFVDGGSTDGTVREIECLIRDHPARDIKLLHQCGDGGKAAAVFEGFDAASGDIVIILDADLTVAPEDLPRFHFALSEGVARFANGDRLAFPMEAGAMPGTNRLGNRIFASVLSTLTGTRLGDTLCGTKALFREDWQRLRVIRADFGGHDPWGDFDLLLGAAALGLTIVDVPIRYHARTAGESKMRPYRHGMALARTCIASLGAHSRAG